MHGKAAVAPGEQARRQPLADGALGYQQFEHFGEHALLVTARAEIPRLARKREQVIVTAFGAIHAREPVVRVAAFEEAAH